MPRALLLDVWWDVFRPDLTDERYDEILDRALSLVPVPIENEPLGPVLLGLSLLRKGRPSEAIEALAALERLEGEHWHPSASGVLAIAHRLVGDPEQASRYLERMDEEMERIYNPEAYASFHEEAVRLVREDP